MKCHVWENDTVFYGMLIYLDGNVFIWLLAFFDILSSFIRTKHFFVHFRCNFLKGYNRALILCGSFFLFTQRK